jgi:hypothetical protein
MSGNPPAPRRFDLAVVVPLDDDHGLGEACIDSWNAQTHPRERLQLVIVDPGNQRNLSRRLRGKLAAHDLWITEATDNEGLLYDRGARAAESDLLMMTEGHCIAERDAAAEILRLFASPRIDAINAASGYLEPNTLARQQSAMEREWFALWPPGHWRTISLRGFAIRHRVYLDLDGFRPCHRRFCANAFAIELDERGLVLAPTSKPIIRHGNSTGLLNLAAALRDSARGQVAWRAESKDELPPDRADRALGGLDAWSQRGDLAPATARVLARAVLRTLGGDLRRRAAGEKIRHELAVLPRFVGASVIGPRADGWTWRLRLARAMAAFVSARFRPAARFDAYQRLWRTAFASGFADFVPPHVVEPAWPAVGAQPVPVASLPDGAVAGLYARERWGAAGPLMRWSGPVFLLRLRFAPAAHRVSLELRAPWPREPGDVTVFLNGSRLPAAAIREEPERLELLLPAERCRADGHQVLALTCCARRPSERGQGDPRRLGLALFAVSVYSDAMAPVAG